MSYERGDIVIVYRNGRNYKGIIHSPRPDKYVFVRMYDTNQIDIFKPYYDDLYNYIIGPYSPLTEALYL